MNLDDSVNLAVENIAQFGVSDITKESLEKKLVDLFKEEFKAEIRAKINRGNVFDMEFKPIQYLLTPKNRFVFDYRKAAIIDPSCVAKYIAIVLMAASTIEKNRVPISDNIVFSSRFNPNGINIFDQNINYNYWKQRTKELANDTNCSYVVQCDIAAFYDRINIHRIESTLISIGVDPSIVKNINDLLLFWSKKDSYGIPVGNVASRILAEAALIDIDQYLIGESIKFVRYVDDYKLFAPNITIAQRWMNKLTTRLFRDGLMLNTAKTNIQVAKKDDSENVDDKQDEADVVLKLISKLTGGYNRITRTFIMPSSEKLEPFTKINVDHEIKELDGINIVDFSGIQKIVIACLVQKKFGELLAIARACSKYMYALDYFVDMLIKNKEFIPSGEKEKVADYYSEMIMNAEFYALEWHEATIAKLLSNDSYFRKNTLLYIFKSPSKEVVTYPSMIALEGLFGKLTRSEFRTIREWFDRCDDWEKRRLIHMSDAMPNDEKSAWAKAIKPSIGNDFLAVSCINKIIKGNYSI